MIRLFANRIDALIAAENYSVKRGYSRENARKFSYAAPVREYGQDTDGLMITPSEVFDCSWRVLDDQGNVIEEVVTTNPSGATVQLRDGDVFESSQCSVWEFYDLSTDSQLPDFDLGGESKDIGQPVGSGTYVVGEAIPSGSYSQVTRAGSLGPCEYSISEKRKGRYVEVLTFSTTNLGSRSPSNVVLDLENGNLYQTDGCGAWQRYEWVSE